LANFRKDLAKQVSQISRVKILKAGDFRFAPPLLLDETEQLTGFDEIAVQGGNAKILPPLYVELTTVIPLHVCSGIGETDNSIQLPLPSYDKGTSIIPLQTTVNEVEISPPIDIDVRVFNLSLDPFSTHFVEFQIDADVAIRSIPSILISSDKIQIFGMNYADKHWRRIPQPKDDAVSAAKSIKSKDRPDDSFVEPKKRGRKPKTQQPVPSVWDLLFAVLQPPLTFGQSENLFLPNAPYPYQWQGIKFLIDNIHALLADDMGTGKTVMTIVAVKILIQQAKVRHVLILCPPSVLYEWKRHLDDWAPELTTYFIRSPQSQRKPLWETPMHVYVTTYDTLRRDIESNILSPDARARFDVVILDEAHHIKNMKSDRFRAVNKLQPQRRWALTGTPVQNKIEDLASIFEFVYSGYLTSYDLYPERIQSKIKPYFLRRRKQEVMPELPPKIYEPIELELDEEQELAYRQAEDGIRLEFSEALGRGERITKQHIFAKLMLLKKLCNFAPGKLSSPKTDSLKEQIEEIIASGEEETAGIGNKVIVFSQFVEEGVSKLEALLAPYGTAKIVGGQTDTIRRGEIEKFKKRKDISVLIASVRSGGEGLNLTEASYVVHFDHWWNPAVMWQAEDRVHRRGQTRGVNIYSYWMKDTIDDRIRQKLREKGILFEQVVDGLAEAAMEESLTVDELLEIIGVKKMEVSTDPVINVPRWQSMSLSEIREKLYEITPSAFEALVRELMHYWGYPNVKVTGKSHDDGIDVLSSRNTSAGIERVAAQCKRYRGNVSVYAARDFFGAISTDKSIKQGFLVTTGEFTSECLQFCESTAMIRAISGMELAKYVKQFGLQA
jgi:superfamily II DNA or RNA helicase